MLKDDGIGVDSKANDGVYTGAFTDTKKEGSYTFEFYASGKNKNELNFNRSETLSEFIKFTATPDNTKVKVIKSIKDKGANLTNLTVRVVPRDNFRNYLGPFSGNKIKIFTNSGEIGEKYIDAYNGTYTFTITHPSEVRPEILVAVNNIIVKHQLTVKLQLINWKIIILINIIILCIIYIYYQYRNK